MKRSASPTRHPVAKRLARPKLTLLMRGLPFTWPSFEAYTAARPSDPRLICYATHDARRPYEVTADSRNWPFYVGWQANEFLEDDCPELIDVLERLTRTDGDALPAITEIAFRGCRYPAVLQLMAYPPVWSALTSFTLDDCAIPYSGFAALAKTLLVAGSPLEVLRLLALKYTDIAPVSQRLHLCERLRELDVTGCDNHMIAVEVAEALPRLSALTDLSVHAAQAAVHPLLDSLRGCPNMRRLSVTFRAGAPLSAGRCGRIVACLEESLPHIERLRLCELTPGVSCYPDPTVGAAIESLCRHRAVTLTGLCAHALWVTTKNCGAEYHEQLLQTLLAPVLRENDGLGAISYI